MGIIGFLVLAIMIWFTFDEVRETQKMIKQLNDKLDRQYGYHLEQSKTLEKDTNKE